MEYIYWALIVIFLIILVSIQFVLNKILVNTKEIVRLLSLMVNRDRYKD